MSMVGSNTPTVTILIPVHNRVGYIRDAIDSILAQTFTDFELLIIDDGSTDGSAHAVAAYRDRRLRLLCNNANLGIPATRNRGIDEARGELLAFLDSDDRARPERLERQVAFLRAQPDYAAVGSWVERMSELGKPSGRIKRKAVTAEQIAAERLFRSCFSNSATMARTAILRRYRHREHIKLGEDYDLWARIAADYKLAALPRVLTYKRQHRGQSTHGQIEEIKAWRLQIYAEQLRLLGIAYSASDLERHFELQRMQKRPKRPDRAYLDWAQEWLQQLRIANARNPRYPEPAFSHVLGTFWLKACWYAAPVLGWRAWRRFWASPLCLAAWPGLTRLARTRFAAQLPTPAWS